MANAGVSGRLDAETISRAEAVLAERPDLIEALATRLQELVGPRVTDPPVQRATKRQEAT